MLQRACHGSKQGLAIGGTCHDSPAPIPTDLPGSTRRSSAAGQPPRAPARGPVERLVPAPPSSAAPHARAPPRAADSANCPMAVRLPSRGRRGIGASRERHTAYDLLFSSSMSSVVFPVASSVRPSIPLAGSTRPASWSRSHPGSPPALRRGVGARGIRPLPHPGLTAPRLFSPPHTFPSSMDSTSIEGSRKRSRRRSRRRWDRSS